MSKIGFKTKPEFKPRAVELKHSLTHVHTVCYHIRVNRPSGRFEATAYVPKEWFQTGSPYPNKISMTIQVPDDAQWDQE